jgi:ribosomal protein S18 acetylase RimI-like enzyme
VRAATPRDLAAIVALRLALLREESGNPFFALPHPDAERRALRLTRAELEGEDQVMLLALHEQEVVGMLRCRIVRRTPLVAESRQAAVTTVYVAPAHRRRGVLRTLLDAADRWCRRRRLTGMRLQCALNNAVGRKAWESLGFQSAELLYLRPVPPA